MSRNKSCRLFSMMLALLMVSTFFTVSAGAQEVEQTPPAQESQILSDTELLDLIERRAFDYFWNLANTDPDSPGYGLVPKGLGEPDVCSMAGVGHALVAYTVGAERGWVSREAAEERVQKTLTTMRDVVGQNHGFWYHFVNIRTGQRHETSEVSSIDSTRAISGALVAGQYFGGDCQQLADELYARMDWNWFINPDTNVFYMGWRPENEFSGHWGNSGEQIAIYPLAIGSSSFEVDPQVFYNFKREYGTYEGSEPVIYSYFGSMHTYIMSYNMLDLRGMRDQVGTNWFENAQRAVQINRQFAGDQAGRFPTWGDNEWGMMACKGPNGYQGRYGAPPCNNVDKLQGYLDGTITPAGAAGAMIFTPEASISALRHYYEDYPQLWGTYGFYDSFNACVQPAWFCEDISVINLGITLEGIENYRTGFVWEQFMSHPSISRGMELAGFEPDEAGELQEVKHLSITYKKSAGNYNAQIRWEHPQDVQYQNVIVYDSTGNQVAGPFAIGRSSCTIENVAHQVRPYYIVKTVTNGAESAGLRTVGTAFTFSEPTEAG